MYLERWHLEAGVFLLERIMNNSSKFFSNKECEYYPCHQVSEDMEFNCLFCYCPLYVLGADCGGNMTFTKQGVKDCSACDIPHRSDAADYIASRWEEIAAKVGNRED